MASIGIWFTCIYRQIKWVSTVQKNKETSVWFIHIIPDRGTVISMLQVGISATIK